MTGGVDRVRDTMARAEDVDLPDAVAAEMGEADIGETGDVRPDGGPPFDDPPESADDLARRAAALTLNDVGNGQRFVLYFGRDVIWVPRVGFFTWTGAVWRKDPDDIEVRRYGQKIGPLISREVPLIALDDWQMALLAQDRDLQAKAKTAAAQVDADGNPTAEAAAILAETQAQLHRIAEIKKLLSSKRKEHHGFARTTGNSARIDALLKEGAVDLSHRFDDLDTAPMDVNTEAGVLRFSVDGGGDTGFSRMARVELVPHDRAQLLTKIMPAGYDPQARAPGFEAFLTRIMPSVEMRRFLQRWYGLSMTALTGEQKMVFQHGYGNNGKSVLVDVMARIFGDYATTAKIESLIGRNRRSGGDATPDLVPLMGARMVRASEPEEGERLQEGKIKELTGGEPMLVRALNEDFVEVRPVFKLTMSGNHKPEIRGTDDGIWRRFLLVPFDVQIPKAERDPDLVEKLLREGPGILNWLVEGLLDYLEGGLQEPDAVLASTKDFRMESDPMGAFLAEETVVTGDSTDFIRSVDLIVAFQFWQYDNAASSWGPRAASLRLKEKSGKWRHPTTGRSFIPGKSGSTGYRGIRLTDVFAARLKDHLDAKAGHKPAKGGGKWQDDF